MLRNKYKLLEECISHPSRKDMDAEECDATKLHAEEKPGTKNFLVIEINSDNFSFGQFD